MYFSPERQPNNEPKAEDNYKSQCGQVKVEALILIVLQALAE